MLKWCKGRHKETTVGYQTIYDSDCEEYRLIHSTIELGYDDPLSDRWYAMFMTGRQEHMIRYHRKRSPAEKTCQRHVKAREKIKRERYK